MLSSMIHILYILYTYEQPKAIRIVIHIQNNAEHHPSIYMRVQPVDFTVRYLRVSFTQSKYLLCSSNGYRSVCSVGRDLLTAHIPNTSIFILLSNATLEEAYVHMRMRYY